jgi:hypothetical protein
VTAIHGSLTLVPLVWVVTTAAKTPVSTHTSPMEEGPSGQVLHPASAIAWLDSLKRSLGPPADAGAAATVTSIMAMASVHSTTLAHRRSASPEQYDPCGG